jgi:hypothetical protein
MMSNQENLFVNRNLHLQNQAAPGYAGHYKHEKLPDKPMSLQVNLHDAQSIPNLADLLSSSNY